MCQAVVHLPHSKMNEAWFSVIEQAPALPNMDLFNIYMGDTWFCTAKLSLFSCYQQRHRTNNVLEGWHSKINKLFKSNANVLYLISVLKDESMTVDFNLLRNELDKPIFRKRAKKITIMDSKIDNIVKSYMQNELPLEQCISKLAMLKY